MYYLQQPTKKLKSKKHVLKIIACITATTTLKVQPKLISSAFYVE